MMRSVEVSTILTMLFVVGCGAGKAQNEEVEVAPKGDDVQVPLFDVPDGDDSLSARDAKALIKHLESGWPAPTDSALAAPSSIEEVVAVLKLDQTDLYAGAVDYIDTKNGLEADALHAQIELAWGEGYTVVSEVMSRCAQQFDVALLGRGGMAAVWPEDKRQRLEKLTEQINRLIEAFQLVSVEHTSKGSQLANDIVSSNPDSYLGYRLAADFYRTMGKWSKFDEMVDNIERLKPESNGLIFLKGAAAFQREQDRFAAAEYYSHALERDSGFVRAQAHMVMIQEELPGLYVQFLKLERLNPNHTVVRWTADVLRLAIRLHEGR